MTIHSCPHQYIERNSGSIVTEKLVADRTISFLYNTMREQAPTMFKVLTGSRMSGLLGYVHFDKPRTPHRKSRQLLKKLGVEPSECVRDEHFYDTHRKVFERQIRYWVCRPMPEDIHTIVAPSDSRVLIGSLTPDSALFIKEKFFTVDELLGNNAGYGQIYEQGDFAVFRLTPDKYHYNHLPVDGSIRDIYQVDGNYHSCNPTAVISEASVHSKNRRIVTIIDTDVKGGTGVGLVAMVEIVALMIGDIVQCYSENRYEHPRELKPGEFCRKGAPKSLFRPGSSTVVLFFEPGKIHFAADIVNNASRTDVQSRFSINLGRPVVETDVKVRSLIGSANSLFKPGV